MNQVIYTVIFSGLFLLTGCSVFHKQTEVKECEEKQITSGEISNVLVKVQTGDRANVYGAVTENGKPVTAGVIFFTNDSTGVTANEFVSSQFSASLAPGVYSIRISGDSNLEYDLGKLEFKSGEVRQVDFTLEGHTLFIEKVSYGRKRLRRGS